MTNDASIIIRLTKKEKATIQKLSLLEGKNMTDFIKSKLFNWQEYSPEEIKKENIQQSEIIMSEMKKYLTPLLKTTMVTHAFIDQTLGTQITQETQQDIINDMKEKLAKIEGKANK